MLTTEQIENLLETLPADSVRPRYFLECLVEGSAAGITYFSSPKISAPAFMLHSCQIISRLPHDPAVKFRIGFAAGIPSNQTEMDAVLPFGKYLHFRANSPLAVSLPSVCQYGLHSLGQVVKGTNLRIVVEVNNSVGPADFNTSFGVVVAELPDSITNQL
jgi:hypothetical protein